MSTKNENVKILITKTELLEKTNEVVKQKIADLKEMLVDNLLSGKDLLAIDSNLLKERIRVYRKIEILLEEVIDILFEKEAEQCQNEN